MTTTKTSKSLTTTTTPAPVSKYVRALDGHPFTGLLLSAEPPTVRTLRVSGEPDAAVLMADLVAFLDPFQSV